jgi:hypothetical protein
MLFLWNAKNIEEINEIFAKNKISPFLFGLQFTRDQISTASEATQRLLFKLLLRADELLKCPLQKWCTRVGVANLSSRDAIILSTPQLHKNIKLLQRGYNGVLQWHCSYCGT